MTFDSKTAANLWLAACETELATGNWIDTEKAEEKLEDYATRWIRQRAGLSPRTRLHYESLLRLHVAPILGDKQLRALSTASIRNWREHLIENGLGASTVAKAYRFLKAVLATAADDGILGRNPCRIVGAGTEHPAERPVLKVQQVFTLADAIEPRYRTLVLLAVFGSLRWGELIGLRKSDFDLDRCTVQIHRSISELPGGVRSVKEPKSAAGRREVALPAFLRDELRNHFDIFAEKGVHGRVFIGPEGVTPQSGNFHKVWKRALIATGLEGTHLHDLRHTGNHLAATAGATTKELMGRMGHSSLQAAMIYQHRTGERDLQIADKLDQIVSRAARQRGKNTSSRA